MSGSLPSHLAGNAAQAPTLISRGEDGAPLSPALQATFTQDPSFVHVVLPEEGRKCIGDFLEKYKLTIKCHIGFLHCLEEAQALGTLPAPIMERLGEHLPKLPTHKEFAHLVRALENFRDGKAVTTRDLVDLSNYHQMFEHLFKAADALNEAMYHNRDAVKALLENPAHKAMMEHLILANNDAGVVAHMHKEFEGAIRAVSERLHEWVKNSTAPQVAASNAAQAPAAAPATTPAASSLISQGAKTPMDHAVRPAAGAGMAAGIV